MLSEQKQSNRSKVFKHDVYDSDARSVHSGMKQRLVGAVVLVSIAVIFLPMIFDRPHEQHRDLIVPIPDQPPEKIINISLPNRPSLKPPIKSHEEDVSRMASQARSTLSGNSVSVQDIEQTATELATANPVKVVPVKEEPQKADPVAAAPSMEKAEASITKPAPSTVKAEIQPETPKKSYNDKSLLEGKWMVQLGSFGAQANALSLSESVRKKGFSVHLLKISSGGQELSKVLAGPFENEAAALAAKQSLDRFFKINSIVVQYE